jgi:signal transduction histidine kinase
LRRHLDVLIALTLTAVGQFEVWSGLVVGGPRVPVAVAIAAGTMAAAFRRRLPTAAVIGTCGAITAQAVLGVDSNTAFAPLLAAFAAIGTAGYLVRRPVPLLACALALVWIAVAVSSRSDPDHRGIVDLIGGFVYAGVIVGMAWLVGRGFAVGRLQAELSDERASAAATQERLRIAREVHDIVAHSISVMALHAGGARRLLTSDQQDARQALELVERTGRDALAEIRGVLDGVRDETAPDPPRPLLADVEELFAPARAAGMATTLHVEGSTKRLPADVDLTVVRILQESVTNVLRHSDAKTLDARLCYSAGEMRVEVTDDGALRDGVGAVGHGLVGMRERVAVVGGSIEAGPLPGRGYRVSAVLPLIEDGS